MISRRSWFEPRRRSWQALPAAAGAIGGWLVVKSLSGSDLTEGWTVPLVVAAVCLALPGRDVRRRNDRWAELEVTCLDEHSELVSAEDVVRRGTPPATEAQRLIAVRIGELRWRELGGWWGPALLAALTVALLVASTRAWAALLVAGTCAVATVVMTVVVLRLSRRRAGLSLPHVVA